MQRFHKKSLLVIVCFLLITLLAYIYFHFLIKKPPKLVLKPVSYAELPGWQDDDHYLAFSTFLKSCTKILQLSPSSNLNNLTNKAYKIKEWQNVCLTAQQAKISNKIQARQFFETCLEPYQVSNNNDSMGLFTGYYLPLLRGNLQQTPSYSVPIYGMPDNLIEVNLALFDSAKSTEKIKGFVKNNYLYPYPDREAINQGAILKHAPIILWAQNKIDVFFAQIQGSALVELEDKKRFILGYANGNGQPYTAIGKILIEKKAIAKENMSMQAIRAWLLQHPAEVDAILNQNRSYVFFNILNQSLPLGSQQVPLTPARSLAIDTEYLPLGIPIWLDTEIPSSDSQEKIPFRHLMVTQDTGKAIKGIVRGDVYWGEGEDAEFISGHMQNQGRYWILLPKHLNKN